MLKIGGSKSLPTFNHWGPVKNYSLHTSITTLLYSKLFFFPFSAAKVFYYESYEGEQRSTDYGTRTSEIEPECGRKVLKVTDGYNRIFVGGKTLKQDGSETADYFDAQNFGQVSFVVPYFLKK